jgi:hypothetical protein
MGTSVTTLQAAIIADVIANLPAAGAAGRLFFATDTRVIKRDTGTGWVDVTPLGPPTAVALAPGAPGNFTVAHGLGVAPLAVVIEMKAGGAVWFQSTEYDATNLYLVASAGGITGSAKCFK